MFRYEELSTLRKLILFKRLIASGIKVVSGAIASFVTKRVENAKSLSVALEPIQDLHGYDKPWSGGSGKNKLTTTGYSGAFYNMPIGTDLKGTGGTASYTQVGNTISVTAGSSWQGVVFATQPLKAGTYHINATTNGSASRGTAYVTDANLIVTSVIGAFTSANMNATVTDGERIAVFFGTNTATTVTWTDSQVEEGSAYTSWTPYSNICPISGHTECVTEVCGVNVWDEEWEEGTINTNGDNSSSTTRWRTKNYISIKPNAQYYFKGTKTGSGTAVIRPRFYDADKVYIGNTSQSGTDVVANAVFTTPANAYYMRFTPDKSGTYGVSTDEVSINYPSTDHDYHAYDGHTYTTPLGRTVYGGTLDVVSGELVVDRAMVDLGTLNWVYNESRMAFNVKPSGIKESTDISLLCSAYANDGRIASASEMASKPNGVMCYQSNGTVFIKNTAYTDAVSFKQAMQGAQLVYELATPQTYQLTPTEVQLLLGTNNVWSDGGNVEVTYKG